MRKLKRLTALLITVLMLFACLACNPSASKPQPTSIPTEEPVAITIAPTEVPTYTPEPEYTPEPGEAAQAAFDEFDKAFFTEFTGFFDPMSIHQLVKDPEAMGIEVGEQTMGEYLTERDSEWESFIVKQKALLMRIDRELLTEDRQIAYDTILHEIESNEASFEFVLNYEPLAPYVGVHSDLPLSFWLYEINNAQDALNYLLLLEDVPRYFESLANYEKARAEAGIFMSRHALDTISEDIDSITGYSGEHFMLTGYTEAVKALSDLDEAAKTEYIARCSAGIDGMMSAYSTLKASILALSEYCSEPVSLSTVTTENQKAYYEYRLKAASNNPNMTPEMARSILLAAMADVFRDYYDSAMAYYTRYSEDPVLDLGSAEKNLEYLKGFYTKILPELPEHQTTLHKVPESLEDVFSPAAYLVSAFDDYSAQVLLDNLSDDDTDVMFTFAHESYPGHLYQHMYHRSIGISLSQQLLQSTAYSEAWSQFSEFLFAVYDTSFNNDYMLSTHAFSQFFTLLEAYVSVEVHCFNASRDALITDIGGWLYWVEEDAVADLADDLIERVYDMPYYMMPYAFGYAQIMSVYNNAEDTLGADFDIKEFLVAYLNIGPTSFDIVADKMNDWVAAK